MFRPSSRMLFQHTRRAMAGMPTERLAGTTRIHFQKLKNIPVEVYPLGVVLAFGTGFGIFSMGKALFFGKNLRKHRQHNNNEV